MTAKKAAQSAVGDGGSVAARAATERWTLVAVLVFTLAVRGAVLWAMRGNLTQDADAYREIAENLLVHGEFGLGKPDAVGGNWQPRPTAYRPPLYPLLLSNLPAADGVQVSLAKVAGLHLLLGVGTVWLTWLTARRLANLYHMAGRNDATRSPASRPGLFSAGPPGLMLPQTVAALFVACDPLLLNQQTLAMTETLAAFLAILALWCLARFDGARTPFNAALAGGVIGLAVLCRPTFLPWLGLVAAGIVVVRGSSAARVNHPPKLLGDLGRRAMNFAGLAIVAAIVVSPWTIRNYRVFGKPIATTTHGGYTLLLGNNESFYEWLNQDKTGIPWSATSLPSVSLAEQGWSLWAGPDIPNLHRFPVEELIIDRRNYEIAKDVIRDHPASFARACIYRVCQLWSPLPHKLTADESTARRWLRYATCVWYCGVYVLVAVGIWRLTRRGVASEDGTPRRAFPTGLGRSAVALLQSPWVWGVLLCLVFAGVHTFYWSNMRMRAPLMPFVAILAGAAALKRES